MDEMLIAMDNGVDINDMINVFVNYLIEPLPNNVAIRRCNERS